MFREWDEKSEFPAAVVKQMGELGLMGDHLSGRAGRRGHGLCGIRAGGGGAFAVDGSVGIIVASHNSLCTNHIMLAGNDEQRKRWVTKLASGEWLGAWGLTEPGSGSDAGGMRTTAVRSKDGRWLGAEWGQGVHHERQLCGLRAGAGE